MKIKSFFSLICLLTISFATFSQESVGLEVVADNLVSPVAFVESPDESGRYFIVDQVGVIRIHTPQKGLLEEPFLNLKNKIVELKDAHEERGLLGLAFHPNYSENGRFFVYYSAPLSGDGPENWDHTSHISEFRVSPDNPDMADKASEKIILKVDQPQDNHNAGTLAFGPDNYLYIALGDGGGANDIDMGHVPDWYEKNAGGNGQDVEQNLLGSILRIDVNGDAPYDIPEDNPFVDKEGMDEIYAYGLRNPYRFSFDMKGNKDLIAGDAGQVLWEEVSVITKGGNYGWNVKEGTHCFNVYNNDKEKEECPEKDKIGNPLINPVIEFKQGGLDDGGNGLVVIGGYVYRGKDLKNMDGKYIFGTWTQHHGKPAGAVFMSTPKETGMWDFQELKIAQTNSTSVGHYLLSFGQNKEGEMFVLTTDEEGPVGTTGKVFKMTSGN
ncbi:PQQ-dependent sugar dehydrogenase [Salinimicrobium sp. MT39]|uniref:PQQ-dependent sugar dehydrogenase n=1 Tax=Salinimicrobium profundisediminis TaxID=2994553 RepID=A0A9X3CWW5_9FLAO|nr:PQQ-dependent sugar dehydrogenase [Salinimicrobium profundisediminis]MCX2838321.1 PQQ-dependent sugar dehydrogenase [Salinimicrobium profundisediminis]